MVKGKSRKIPVEEALNSCCNLFEVMGQQYFNLKNLTARNVDQRPSVLRIIYMLVLVTTLYALLVAATHSKSEGKITPKNVITFALKRVLHTGMTSVLCLSFVQSFVTTKSKKKMFLILKEISEIFRQEFDFEVDLESYKKKTWKRLSFILTCFLFMHGTVVFSQEADQYFVLRMVLSAFPFVFMIVSVYKVIFFVDLINFYLEDLETLLMNILQSEPVGIIETMKLHLKSVKSMKDPIDDLRIARKIFNLIGQCAELQNKSQGFIILVMLSTMIISVTATGYDLFVVFVSKGPTEPLPGKI